MDYEFEQFAPQGWQCPICKRVYSPTTPMCWYCGSGKQSYTTSTGTYSLDKDDSKITLKDIYPGYMPNPSEWGHTKTEENK